MVPMESRRFLIRFNNARRSGVRRLTVAADVFAGAVRAVVLCFIDRILSTVVMVSHERNEFNDATRELDAVRSKIKIARARSGATLRDRRTLNGGLRSPRVWVAVFVNSMHAIADQLALTSWGSAIPFIQISARYIYASWRLSGDARSEPG